MNEYVLVFTYFNIALIGCWLHYMKKYHVDKTTTDCLYDYVNINRVSTMRTLCTLVGVAITGSVTHKTGYYFSPQELYTIIVSGYTADSILNKSSEVK